MYFFDVYTHTIEKAAHKRTIGLYTATLYLSILHNEMNVNLSLISDV